MISFESDYVEGAHPLILERMIETNFIQCSGYGNDIYSANGIKKIKQACNREDIDVHLLVGGTQSNLIVISSILRPHQGVLSPSSGHIANNETGAIEATGHKILELPTTDGKINAVDVKAYAKNHFESDIKEHLVQPGMVYISLPTERGTMYSLSELKALRIVCDEYNLPLFIDGARLAYGLGASQVTLEDLCDLADIFYIGGTKCGALLGEAVIISNLTLATDFRYIMKQRGALLAKGRILGIQFETLFTDDLYLNIGKKAVDYAIAIKEAFLAKKIELLVDSSTNQQFPIVSVSQKEALEEKYTFEVWEPVGENLALRFCTSWATKESDVTALIKDIAAL